MVGVGGSFCLGLAWPGTRRLAKVAFCKRRQAGRPWPTQRDREGRGPRRKRLSRSFPCPRPSHSKSVIAARSFAGRMISALSPLIVSGEIIDWSVLRGAILATAIRSALHTRALCKPRARLCSEREKNIDCRQEEACSRNRPKQSYGMRGKTWQRESNEGR